MSSVPSLPDRNLPTPKSKGTNSKTDWKAFSKKTIVLVFLFSLAVHALLLIGFGGVTLFKGRTGTLAFVTESVPADASAPPPPPPDEEIVQGERTSDPNMPDETPASHELAPPLEIMSVPRGANWASAIPNDRKASLSENMAGASSKSLTRSTKGSGLARKSSFFGIRVDESTPRILLLLDTSDTMFRRKRGTDTYTYDYGIIKKEACDLIENLDEEAQFNVVLYEGGAVALEKNMMGLSEGFKSEASQWISNIDERPGKSIQDRKGNDTLLEGGGTRLDTGLRLAFRYDPTTIFLLTDGDANIQSENGSKKLKKEDIIHLIKQLQSKQRKSATIHVIYYQTKEAMESEVELAKAIATQGRGTYKVTKASMIRSDANKQGTDEKKK